MARKRFFMFVALALLSLSGAAAHAQRQNTFVFPVYGQDWSSEVQGMEYDGYKDGYWHTGSDIAPRYRNTNPYVVASNAGQIYSITKNGQSDHGEGNSVIIRHVIPVSSNGSTANLYTQYSHLKSFASNLYAGKAVKRGEIIGVMGSTAYGSTTETTVHLHFEVKWGGVLHNPWNYPSRSRTQYWGYTPYHPTYYGWVDPYDVINDWDWTANQ